MYDSVRLWASTANLMIFWMLAQLTMVRVIADRSSCYTVSVVDIQKKAIFNVVCCY